MCVFPTIICKITYYQIFPCLGSDMKRTYTGVPNNEKDIILISNIGPAQFKAWPKVEHYIYCEIHPLTNPTTENFFNPNQVGGGAKWPAGNLKNYFSATGCPIDLKPGCKFEFIRCLEV